MVAGSADNEEDDDDDDDHPTKSCHQRETSRLHAASGVGITLILLLLTTVDGASWWLH